MRARLFEGRGPMRLMDNSQRFGSHQSSDDIGMTMLKIAHMRYQLFRARFGRDPEANEPLFFDPEESEPVVAGGRGDCKRGNRVIGAARTSNSIDAVSVSRRRGRKSGST
jgi:hypothetical protein